MNKFNVYELLGRLAEAVGSKTDVKNAPEPVEKPAPTEKKSPPSPEKRQEKELAVIEMIKNHDKLSRKIDEKITESREENAKTPRSAR